MKNHVDYVIPLYEGLLLDLTIQWPDLKSSADKDLSYLRRAHEQRGLSFFTITLPAFGLWIDRSLDEGCLLPGESIPRGIPRSGGRPGLFRGVLRKVFDNEGMLRSNADLWGVRFLRTLCQSFKKLEVPVGSSRIFKTLKEFYDVEANLPLSHQNTWDSDVPIWCERDGHPIKDARPFGDGQLDMFAGLHQFGPQLPWRTLRALARRVTAELGIPDWWTLRPKHGPGAVSDPAWKFKYDFPNWPRKLDLWFPYDWFGRGEIFPDTWPEDRELPSRLIAVPKTAKGPRLICKEPIAHQWIQQGIWRWLDERIPGTVLSRSISLRDQEESRVAALSASRSGSKATLDLSAASDRLSTRLVEYIFQGSELLDGIHACRTRYVKQSLDPRLPQMWILRKFATMGSALTFPIQTIVFTILSVWALRLAEGREDDWSNWKADFDRVRVFGDDLIVPTHAYSSTKLVLHECGLLINADKSFKGVAFRESCGMDAFRGVDVTPPRHRKPYDGAPSSTVALIEYSNNLYSKGYWYASDRALGVLPQATRKRLAVVRPNDGVLGLHSFGAASQSPHLQRKWDNALQREYYVSLGVYTRGRSSVDPGPAGLADFLSQQNPGGMEKQRDELLSHLHCLHPKVLMTSGSSPELAFKRVRVYP